MSWLDTWVGVIPDSVSEGFPPVSERTNARLLQSNRDGNSGHASGGGSLFSTRKGRQRRQAKKNNK